MVARVRLEDRRDAEACRLAHLLDRIGEGRDLERRDVAGVCRRCGGHQIAQDEAAHLLVADVVGRRGGNVASGVQVQRVDQHHAGLFVERHLADEVGHALLGRPPPVLIRVELTVAVGIAKLIGVHRRHVLAAHADGRLRRAVVVVVAAAEASPARPNAQTAATGRSRGKLRVVMSSPGTRLGAGHRR